MARVFIDDRWLKTADDGTEPSAAAKRSLANARDPFKARVPEKWRTSTYGTRARWRVRWYAKGVGGGRGQKSKSFRLLADAEAYKAGLEDDVRRGRYHDPRQELRLFSDVAEAWLGTKLDIRPGTLGRYRREIEVYVNPRWGLTPMRGFGLGELQEWVSDLQSGDYPAALSNGRDPVPLKPRSIRNIVKVVMAGVFDYAVRSGWIMDNPIRQVVVPKVLSADDEIVFLSIEEVELQADSAVLVARPVDALIIRWQAYVGLRIGETLGLRVADLDLSARRAKVRRTWTRDGDGKPMLSPPKSGHSHIAAIPAFLIGDLQEQVRGRGPEDYVFRAKQGGPMAESNWRNRVWYKALKAAGMEDSGITIHSLRHTYASIAIANGADVKTLQRQMDHASATITLDTYAALWPERLDDVADAVGAARSAVIVSIVYSSRRGGGLPRTALFGEEWGG